MKCRNYLRERPHSGPSSVDNRNRCKFSEGDRGLHEGSRGKRQLGRGRGATAAAIREGCAPTSSEFPCCDADTDQSMRVRNAGVPRDPHAEREQEAGATPAGVGNHLLRRGGGLGEGDVGCQHCKKEDGAPSSVLHRLPQPLRNGSSTG